jgi:hypothetical protein
MKLFVWATGDDMSMQKFRLFGIIDICEQLI